MSINDISNSRTSTEVCLKNEKISELFTNKWKLLPSKSFNSALNRFVHKTLSEETCRKIFELYKNEYYQIKFLWWFVHPTYKTLNHDIITRLTEIVDRNNPIELSELQWILPEGIRIIDPKTDKEAFEYYKLLDKRRRIYKEWASLILLIEEILSK